MRLLRQSLAGYVSVLCLLVLAATLAGCGTPSQPNRSPKPPPHDPNQDPLRIGDKVRVDLSGIPDNIEHIDRDIQEDGSITLPFVGKVTAAGRTPTQLEEDITHAYVPRYYNRLNVTVTPTARFFYVMGQVNNNAGGRILYTGPITVLGAIAAAGDFTPFAKKKDVQITRANGNIEHVNCVKAIKHPELDVPIYPGDRIQVGRRF